MNRTWGTWRLGFVLLAGAAAAAGERTASPPLERLGWMAGDWETRDVAPYVEEHWTRAAGGTMLGTGRTVAQEKTVEFEFLRIETRAEEIYYVPQPGGRPPVDFKFTPTTAMEAVFVNPGHRDPLKKIVYRKNADGTLAARIEGEANGKAFSKEWHYFPMGR